MNNGIQTLQPNPDIYAKSSDAVILAVSHHQFLEPDCRKFTNGNNALIFDIKGVLPKDLVVARL